MSKKAVRFAEFLRESPRLLSRKAQHLGSKIGLQASKEHEIAALNIVDRVNQKALAIKEQFNLSDETLETLSSLAEQEMSIANKVLREAQDPAGDAIGIAGREFEEITARFDKVLKTTEETLGPVSARRS